MWGQGINVWTQLQACKERCMQQATELLTCSKHVCEHDASNCWHVDIQCGQVW
jgi:hypothetical protein